MSHSEYRESASPRLALTVATPGAPPSAFVVYREPLSRSLPKIAAMGWDGVELALLDRSQVDLAELRALLMDTGLSVPTLSTGQIFATGRCSFASAEPGVRQKAEDLFAGVVEIAAELGAMVNIGRVRGGIEGNGERPEVEARVADSLSRILGRAKAAGVALAIEPVNRYEIDFLNNCEEAVDFLARQGLEDIGLMPDVFHMNIEEPSIEGSLGRFGGRIRYVHFADSNRRHPGAGHLDFAGIVGALRSVGYDGWIGAEILPLPDPDFAAKSAIAYLRRFL